MHAVVTAGGTREPIDDVRVVTNLSTGRFGAACARALVERGCDVTLLANTDLARHHDWLDPRIRVVPFGSFRELDAALRQATEDPPDLLLMAAAVSDYAPVPATGKIRSDDATLSIEMVRNDKLIATLRARCGPHTTLVGFKLLSGVSPAELHDNARRQIAANQLDLCFANDLAELGGDTHPAWLVSADGQERLTGSRQAVADALVERALRTQLPAADAAQGLHDMGGPDGRLHRASTADPEVAALLAALPDVDMLLEIPEGLALTTAESPLQAPAALAALARTAAARRWHGGGFALRDPEAGTVWVGLTEAGAAVARHRWERLRRAAPLPSDTELRAVFDGPRPIGWTATDPHTDATTLWLDPSSRGAGRGDDLALQLSRAGRRAWVPGGWDAVPWLQERGFQPVQTLPDEGGTVLAPPSARTDLRRAASVCLLDPVHRRVLLGRRLTPPWNGHWAFPGGSHEGDETLLQTALRELEEETGIAVPRAEALAERLLVVGDTPGYEVHNFVVSCPHVPPPRASAELDARWVDLHQTHTLRPMAAGTRRILRRLMTSLAQLAL
ncbi:MAG: NUDIX domain-containing protein [Myxococcales bacterium]|nr:NUDIX domain-containing protein [Myxococcales bacterium]